MRAKRTEVEAFRAAQMEQLGSIAPKGGIRPTADFGGEVLLINSRQPHEENSHFRVTLYNQRRNGNCRGTKQLIAAIA